MGNFLYTFGDFYLVTLVVNDIYVSENSHRANVYAGFVALNEREK